MVAGMENFTWDGYRKPVSAQPGDVDILSYMRIAVPECAGFPALLGDQKFEPIRRELLQGIRAF